MSFKGSTILNDAQQKLLLDYYGNAKQNFKLLYKASVHGFESKVFHANCDGKGETITIAKSENGYIFGGYNPNSWKSSAKGEFENCFAAWIFSLTNPKNKPFKAKTLHPAYAIYHHDNHLPTFGTNGHDIALLNNCNTAKNGACLGQSYKLPNFISPGKDAILFMTGQDTFKVSDVEVFTLE